MIYLLTGRKPKRMGHAHPSIVPYQAFKGSDGKWFIVAAANDRFYRKLCEALGREDLINDPRFKTNPDRVKNRDELVRILSEIFKSRERDHWIKLLRGHGVPVAPVYELDEVFRDPYASKLVVELKHPILGSVKQLIEPGTINGNRPLSDIYPPKLGEYTIEILHDLGYSSGDIERLIREGVVRVEE